MAMKKKAARPKPADAPATIIHKFSIDSALSWLMMPQLLNRVGEFCGKLNTDTSAEVLVPQVRAAFAVGSPDFSAWGMLQGNRLVGHVIASKEAYGNTKPYVLILQAEMDGVYKNAPQIFEEVKTWTQSLKLSEIRNVTARGESIAKKYGFERKLEVLSYMIQPEK